MKIVVLDGYTLNPGDLSWEGLAAFGDLKVYDRTAPDEVVERSKNATVILTNKTPLTSEMLGQLPDLRYIGVLATGYNIVDTAAAKKRGIPVANAPAYSTYSVVQMTFALLLELCLHVKEHSDSVKVGQWSRSADFCYWNTPLTELAGKTMGIIGYGTIGKKVAEAASAFGMQVITVSHSRKQAEGSSVKTVSLDGLLNEADVISIHCPLTPETRGLINSEHILQMKRSALLINTSRGPIVVEPDLADALNRDMIAGAGLDVLSVEPPLFDNPLIHAKNCIITPHIAWATREARTRLMQITIDNLAGFLSGKPRNIVNL